MKKHLSVRHHLVDYIIAFETGDLDDDQTIKLFAELIRTGRAWSLQGSYGRMAASFIENGYINDKGEIL